MIECCWACKHSSDIGEDYLYCAVREGNVQDSDPVCDWYDEARGMTMDLNGVNEYMNDLQDEYEEHGCNCKACKAIDQAWEEKEKEMLRKVLIKEQDGDEVIEFTPMDKLRAAIHARAEEYKRDRKAGNEMISILDRLAEIDDEFCHASVRYDEAEEYCENCQDIYHRCEECEDDLGFDLVWDDTQKPEPECSCAECTNECGTRREEYIFSEELNKYIEIAEMEDIIIGELEGQFAEVLSDIQLGHPVGITLIEMNKLRDLLDEVEEFLLFTE